MPDQGFIRPLGCMMRSDAAGIAQVQPDDLPRTDDTYIFRFMEAVMGMSRKEIERFMDLCDDNGKRVYSRIFELARERKMSVDPTRKGFTLWEYVSERKVELLQCQHGGSDWDQSIWVTFSYPTKRGNTGMPDDVIDDLLQRAVGEGPFQRTPCGAKLYIDWRFADDTDDAKLNSLIEWLESVSDAVGQHRAS